MTMHQRNNVTGLDIQTLSYIRTMLEKKLIEEHPHGVANGESCHSWGEPSAITLTEIINMLDCLIELEDAAMSEYYRMQNELGA